ncbi:MAG: hypothetical protein P4L79_10870 [Legionella sp.]|uniref:hypothetical protein n=1 Tax=Legionella sp. TaxID=459 RepID=UPI00284C8E68|nr:hypothetical protein [Legionella sp.]
MPEVTLSEYYSTGRTRRVTVTKNENTLFLYFYENNELVDTVRNPRNLAHAEQLAEDFVAGLLNPKLLLG